MVRVPILLIPIIMGISACSGSAINPITQIRSTPIDRPKLILPEVTTLTSHPVEWKVITPQNIDSVFAEMSAANQTPVLFAVTNNGYQNISFNLSEISRLIKEQSAIILAYKNYYEKADIAIRTYNATTTK